MADAEAILRECPAVEAVAPTHNGTAQIVFGHMNWSTAILGTTPSMLDIREWRLTAGRSFTSQDVKSATKVALLGQVAGVSRRGRQRRHEHHRPEDPARRGTHLD
jgi:putative ABC transport system permease protein